MQINLNNIFPNLSSFQTLEEANIKNSDLEDHQYFNDLNDLILQQHNFWQSSQKKNGPNPKKQRPPYLFDVKSITNIKSTIKKCTTNAKVLRISKGTVLYTPSMLAQEGYLLIYGCVELLTKKNNRQKAENYPGHVCFKADNRAQLLSKRYNIKASVASSLESLFFDDLIMFSYLDFKTVYANDYFGFKQLVRGSFRTKIAVVVEDSLLVKIGKIQFDKYLKEYEEKKQAYIAHQMLKQTSREISFEIMPKLAAALSSSEIVRYCKDQVLFKEDMPVNGAYFILNGEISISKNVAIEIPKKITNQNKGDIVKDIEVTLCKQIKNSYLGEIQLALSIKNREFTSVSQVNNALLIKFQATTFLKVLSESFIFERDFSYLSKQKLSSNIQNYMNLKTQLLKTFMQQFQQIDNRKKEKKVVGLLQKDSTFKNKQLYEVFQKEGAFYRDSFEKLEGFDKFQAEYDPKKSSISRFKITDQLKEEQKKKKNLKKNINKLQTNSEKRLKPIKLESSIDEQDYDEIQMQAVKKMLTSPKKNKNPMEFLHDQVIEEKDPSQENSQDFNRKKKRIVSKFKDLKKDQSVFKRVMIMNGRYQVSRATAKQNMVKAIVNHQFDEVVKQCISRKSQHLRKAPREQMDGIASDIFQRTVSSLKKKSISINKFNNFSTPCKSTDEMRKKLQNYRKSNVNGRVETLERERREDEMFTSGKFRKSSEVSHSTNARKTYNSKDLGQCIGFNRQPQSSEIKTRAQFSSTLWNNNSPQKIILLNHMMKPITYYSAKIQK